MVSADNSTLFSAIISFIIYLLANLMISLTANALKRGGVSALKSAMQKDNEHQVAIDVRGKPEYVVLDIEQYNVFREYELDKAIKEAETDYANGHYDVVDDFDKLAEELQQVTGGN
ncbi:MAG: hypothetical protein ACI8WB_003059 [Phenylobacterium sp.]|jgi:hypothetical protein